MPRKTTAIVRPVDILILAQVTRRVTTRTHTRPISSRSEKHPLSLSRDMRAFHEDMRPRAVAQHIPIPSIGTPLRPFLAIIPRCGKLGKRAHLQRPDTFGLVKQLCSRYRSVICRAVHLFCRSAAAREDAD